MTNVNLPNHIVSFICSGDHADYSIYVRETRETVRIRIFREPGKLFHQTEPRMAHDVIQLPDGQYELAPLRESLKPVWAEYLQVQREAYEAERAKQIERNPENAKYYLPYDEMDGI